MDELTDVETLREAAQVMRDNATDAADHQVPEGRWGFEERFEKVTDRVGTVADVNGDAATRHIASWDPAVALAVADSVDLAGDWTEEHPGSWPPWCTRALAVARTFLRIGEA